MTARDRSDRLGRIVWHDLHTFDAGKAMVFYRKTFGWRFVEERTERFAWGDGPGIYRLAFLDSEAGAGLVEQPERQATGWVPYVEVSDVDRAVAQVEPAGGRIERAPFEVPGVGINAIVLDPVGARLGLTATGHNFPRPTLQFGTEHYIGNGGEAQTRFYALVCDWAFTEGGQGFAARTAPRTPVVVFDDRVGPDAGSAHFVPSIRGALDGRPGRLLSDPCGALLLTEEARDEHPCNL